VFWQHAGTGQGRPRGRSGEFFGLLGPNGAGKTTLISALAGLVRADSGSLCVMGHDVQADYRAARRHLGVVPQELVFDPFFTVRESLKIQSGYFGIRDNDAWIDEILENLGLTSKANANMRMLSGGMKRRVLVAQALVHRPPVIVLDEPTAGVDVELRQTLWALHPAPERSRPYHRADHALPRRSREPVRPHRHAQGRSRRRAGYHRQPAAALFVPHPALAQSWRMPADLVRGAAQSGGWWSFPFDDFSEVEPLLARIRAAGCRIEDLEIGKPDLEEVFIRVMQGQAETPAN
jgi:ABC-2 type transport system ATP-binding protein